MWRRYAIRLIQCLIVLIVLGTVAAILDLYPALRLLAAQLKGGDRCVCSVGEAAFQYRKDIRTQRGLTKRYMEQCRELKTDARGFVLWRSPKGEFWLPSGPGYLLPHLLAEEDRGVYGSPAQGVRRGDVVLDCGAHIGVFVRASLSAGASLVIAIEPAPENIECLRRNFQSDIEAGRVIISPKGVWNKEDTLILHLLPTNSAGNSLVGGSWKGGRDVSVPLTTIDSLSTALQLKQVDFIKMDIEGAEVPALSGAENVLRRFRPRLAVAAYHLKNDPERIRDTILNAVPDYRVQCGSYILRGNERDIVPETLFFQ